MKRKNSIMVHYKQTLVVMLLLIILTLSSQTTGQSKHINTLLKGKIDSLFKQDQLYRRFLLPRLSSSIRDSLAEKLQIPLSKLDSKLLQLQNPIDESNYQFIDSLFKSSGYPGKSLIGKASMNYAAIIILHSSQLNKHIRFLEEEAKKGELDFSSLALIIDRNHVQQSKKQVYGTQVITMNIEQIGKKSTISYMWPIADAVNVNERRKAVGLSAIESYAALFGIEYTPKFLSIKKLNRYLKRNRN